MAASARTASCPARACSAASAHGCHDGRVRPDQHQPEPAPRIAPVTFERGRKPFIPAHIIRAANDAGQSLDVFVTALILRGFAAFEAANSKGA